MQKLFNHITMSGLYGPEDQTLDFVHTKQTFCQLSSIWLCFVFVFNFWDGRSLTMIYSLASNSRTQNILLPKPLKIIVLYHRHQLAILLLSNRNYILKAQRQQEMEIPQRIPARKHHHSSSGCVGERDRSSVTQGNSSLSSLWNFPMIS